MRTIPTSRRGFLARLPHLIVAGISLPVILRCGSGAPPGPGLAEQAQAYRNALDCTSTQGLWEAEINTRIDNDYVDRSGRTDQYCFNCKNFEPPKDEQSCASCRTVKGPVHPIGWCKSWTEKP